jgi:hypothetical protein
MARADRSFHSPGASSHLEQALQLSIESLEREYAVRRSAAACGKRALSASVSKAYRLAIASEAERLERLRQDPAPPAVPY